MAFARTRSSINVCLASLYIPLWQYKYSYLAFPYALHARFLSRGSSNISYKHLVFVNKLDC